jgi:phosphatidylserine decarboxylase
VPRSLRRPLYGAFARWVGARVEEAELPLDEYPSLGAFFARRLRPGARPVDPDPMAVIAPCDGLVTAVGVTERGRLIQAKGLDYALADLVADPELADAVMGGVYVTIYLSPKDYHRVHAPIDGALEGYTYLPGRLFPVNEQFAHEVPDLLSTNERVVFRFRSAAGTAVVAMVGALGVSNIQITHNELEIRMLRSLQQRRSERFTEPVPIARGDEIGAFYLGSTAIVLFEPGQVALDAISVGDVIRFGTRIGIASANVSAGAAGRPVASSTSDKLSTNP